MLRDPFRISPRELHRNGRPSAPISAGGLGLNRTKVLDRARTIEPLDRAPQYRLHIYPVGEPIEEHPLPGELLRREARPDRAEQVVSDFEEASRALVQAATDGGPGRSKPRSSRNSGKLLANSEWERNQTDQPDPATFEKEIGPKLKTVSLLETMRATGLSRTYCGMIRRGVRVPHPRHWEVLRELVSLRNTSRIQPTCPHKLVRVDIRKRWRRS